MRLFLAGLAFLPLFFPAREAQAAGEPSPPPQKITVGVYVSSITDVSLRENHFFVDLYVWFRWTGAATLDPLRSFDVANSRVTTRSGEVREEHKDFHYASCRVNAEITHFFEVSRFPLDDHVLRIEIEDTEKEADFVEYVADTANSGLAPGIEVPGWRILPATVSVTRHHYPTSYGVIDLPSGRNGSDYSQLVLEMPLAREGCGYFVKLFFVLFLSVWISLLAFCIRPDQVDPRFGLPVGAIFAAVGSLYVVSAQLPDTSVVTLSDRLHMLAFAAIVLTLTESALVLSLWNRGKQELARRIDGFAFWTFVGLYAVSTALAVIIR